MMLKKGILGLGCLLVQSLAAQPSGKAAEVFALINEARTQPQAFLAKYEADLEELDCGLLDLLADASPIEKAIWDEGLAVMAKKEAGGELEPDYAGKNAFCGTASSAGSGRIQDALTYLCDFHTLVLDSDYRFFGIYLQTDVKNDDESGAYYWGIACDRLRLPFVWEGRVDTSKVDFKSLQTADQASYMTRFDQEMVREINFVRRYPTVYADVVARYLQKESLRWGGLSKDEWEAGMELIAELKKMQPVSILQPKSCVYDAAKKHGLDCQKRGFSDHTGSDGSHPWDRIARQCADMEGNENLVGGAKNAREMVIGLLLDPGISSRGHRRNMLDPKWKYVGCYGYQGEDMWEAVQNFATD